MDQYIPGVCNIGAEEINVRRKAAIFSAVIAVAVIILLLLVDVSRAWRLTLFRPAASFGIGWQQWHSKFCVGFGIKGVFNFGKTGTTFSVEQEEYLRKDRRKAWRMIGAGAGFGLLAALLFYFL